MLQQPGIVSGCNDSRGMTMSNLAIDIKHFFILPPINLKR